MIKVVRMTLSKSSIDAAIKELREYQERIKRKTSELAERLAEMGAVNVSLGYARAIYTGPKDISVTVEQRGESTYAIVATGDSVLVVEFGAGVTYGNDPTHPKAGEFGYGVGTYPGQIHAFDPNGWWLPKDKGGGHTFGNPASMIMYKTAKELRREVERVAREVFST